MSVHTGEHWQQVKALFESALEHPQAAREAFVRASGADAAVQDEVLSLLAHERALSEATTDDFLAPTEPAAPPLLLSPGERLGAWEIVGPLGAGGMAEVMLARRADGAWDGEAAVKVLKRGMDSAAVLARFALEQRALARLNHPHIAHLLDAGRSASGLPYFVMELVRGRPIDQACEGLALEARLGLFLQLADAVAFAHRQLLVHRDLKPSNVLVTEDGQVKLLDFGIAKALDPAEGEHTGAGPRPYTPNYASPEQVRGEPVGTLTDIYSLGVLLYVMLTGLRPYGRNATTPQEAARSVLEEEPTRPSALSPGLVSDPQWMATRKRLKGDLDNILLKALYKAPAARYPSVDAFAADVRAHLAGLPVSARAPSAGYLLSRFVLRHRAASAAAALAAVSLVVGAGVAGWQAHVAGQRLEQLRGLSRDVVLRYADAVTYLPGGLVVKENLLKGLLGQLSEVEQEAGDDAEWLALLAGVYARLAQVGGDDGGVSLSKMGEARQHAEHAITLARQVLPARPDDAALSLSLSQALQIRARAQRADGQPEQGLKTLEEAMALIDQRLQRLPAAEQRDLQVQRASLQIVEAQFFDQQTVASLNRPEDALALYGQAEQALRRLERDGDASLAPLLGTLLGARAITHARLGRLDASRGDAEAAWQQRLRAVQAEPFHTGRRDELVTEATNAAVILMRADQPARAVLASQAAWDTVQRLAAENGPQSKWAENLPRVAQHHGRALALVGRSADALPVLDSALAYWQRQREAKPGPHPERLWAWLGIYRAVALLGLQRRDEALTQLRQSQAILEPLSRESKAGDALLNLAESALVMAAAEPAAAPAWRQRALQHYQAADALRALNGEHLRRRDALARGEPIGL
ncbi:serine/threonine protein kinase [Ideonella sp. 4Y16]|uniref:serine/threonine-protein kinase n=1 Tax=Ideonella alba TaxID=2824118 RepID=UPI001B358F5A|nr:serine/threonine-protein kinase [Ideonella alba]MBQ0943239.1 serine/threonine protein kinase [Ideonella alba]